MVASAPKRRACFLSSRLVNWRASPIANPNPNPRNPNPRSFCIVQTCYLHAHLSYLLSGVMRELAASAAARPAAAPRGWLGGDCASCSEKNHAGLPSTLWRLAR